MKRASLQQFFSQKHVTSLFKHPKIERPRVERKATKTNIQLTQFL